MKFWPLVKVLPVKTNLHFVRWARPFAALSVIAVLASLALTLYPFKPPCFGLACGIDFKGGTVMDISTAPAKIDTHRVRVALESINLGEVQVQGFGGYGYGSPFGYDFGYNYGYPYGYGSPFGYNYGYPYGYGSPSGYYYGTTISFPNLIP